jgi:valyl-tRNA synthetase
MISSPIFCYIIGTFIDGHLNLLLPAAIAEQEVRDYESLESCILFSYSLNQADEDSSVILSTLVVSTEVTNVTVTDPAVALHATVPKVAFDSGSSVTAPVPPAVQVVGN